MANRSKDEVAQYDDFMASRDAQLELRSGVLSATLDNGQLRYIRVGGVEILRGIYVAVRDGNWGTVIPEFTCHEVSQDENSFQVTFTARHVDEHVSFIWNGSIKGRADGILEFVMDGEAAQTFYKNRIGFCLLHPMELSGQELTVMTPEGETKGKFPVEISPHQPFMNMVGIRHKVKDIDVSFVFEGDIFEMEDQRNWTDASYKTYCTPLGLPFPVKVEKGERIYQKVRIEFSPVSDSYSAERPTLNQFVVGDAVIGKLPAIGFADSASRQLDTREVELLGALCPDHLRGELDLCAAGWRDEFAVLQKNAISVGAKMDLEVLVEDYEPLHSFLSLVKKEEKDINRLLLFDKWKHITTEDLMQEVHRIADELEVNVTFAGGSRAFFTELNRAKNLPVAGLRIGAYPLTPQVHAFDDVSLMETLQAQPVTVQTAKSIFRGKPICVGPVTFNMRFNPNATADITVESSEEGEADPRQHDLFGAAWTLGSVTALAEEQVHAITYYRTTGVAGVVTEDCVSPLYHVFHDIGEFQDADVLECQINDATSPAALCLQRGTDRRVLIANLTPDVQEVQIEQPSLRALAVRVLDENNIKEAINSPEKWRKESVSTETDLKKLTLPGYAVVTIDYSIA